MAPSPNPMYLDMYFQKLVGIGLNTEWQHSSRKLSTMDTELCTYQHSARPIGQASNTKEYLSSINLPDGPIFLNPTSMINATMSEVKGHSKEFKIDVLRKLKTLFPETYNPFSGGFGNRETDVGAYQAVGIPDHMIFTINQSGELRNENGLKSSYGSLDAEQFFPPI